MKHNILILHTDAQMQQWLGAAGNSEIHTPHLDKLAAEGMYFSNAQTCSGVCMPARASLMTGRYPVGTGVTCNEQKLPATEKTLGQYFAEVGYETGYFGKTHFGASDDEMPQHGWQKYFGVVDYNQYLNENGIDLHYPEKAVKRNYARYWHLGASSIPEDHYFEKVVADGAMNFINEDRENPFLCVASWIAPHGPFTPPERFAQMYDPAKITLAPRCETELENKPEVFVRWVTQNQKYVNEDELRHFLSLVYALTSLVDEQVGRLMQCLRERGLLESTLVIFASDHGDFGTGYGIFGKSWNMIDPLIRIPLIARAPGLNPPKSTFEGLVENIDILPTLLECADIEVPASIQGKSFWPLLEREKFESKSACFAFNSYESSRYKLAQSTIRSGQWRLIVSESGADQLYNVPQDPWNWHNVARKNPDVVSDLKNQLLQWQIGAAGLGYNRETANFWEDTTLFWDETQFTGRRIKLRSKAPVQ
jgi:arylsulfatase A-like enzyme